MIVVIEAKILIEWSSGQVSGWLLDNQEQLISHGTIYFHVWADKQAVGDLYTHLRQHTTRGVKASLRGVRLRIAWALMSVPLLLTTNHVSTTGRSAW